MVPIIVINLRRSTGRREAMEHNFRALGVPVAFFEGVDAQTMTDAEIAVLSPTLYVGHKCRPLSRGEIACAESFRRVLTDFAASGGDYLCVAEDDADFSAAALAWLDRAALRRLEPFDILRLADDPGRGRGLTRIVAGDATRAVHAPLRLGFFMLAQVFSRDGALKVLDALVPLWAPIDNLIYRDSGVVGLRVLELRPAVVEPRATATDIGERYGHQPIRPAWQVLAIEVRRRLFLLSRRFRAVGSYVQAWGWRALLSLRSQP